MLEIYSERELIEKVSDENYLDKVCISIGDPDKSIHEIIQKSFKKILRLEFHDEYNLEGYKRDIKVPQKEDIQKIIDFYNNNKTEDFVIHCHAGVSRSTATGLIILYLMHNSIDAAGKELKKIRFQAMPNLRMIELFDNLYETNLLGVSIEINRNRINEIKSKYDKNMKIE